MAEIVRVHWATPSGFEYDTLLRDPREQGDFLVGVECNEHGVGVREGCTEDVAMMIRRDRVRDVQPFDAAVTSIEVGAPTPSGSIGDEPQ